MFTESCETLSPLHIITWLQQHALSVIWHQKRPTSPRYVLLRFRVATGEWQVKGHNLPQAIQNANLILTGKRHALRNPCVIE